MKKYTHIYMIGIGGIGMSALARYFLQEGYEVAGYDRTPTALTNDLEREGATMHFNDLGDRIPASFDDAEKTLVIYTPAVSEKHGELQYFKSAGFDVKKRAEVLGMITRNTKALAVAGTHGKTTTSTMLAHVLNESDLKCNAFLGGISTNFNSNYIGDPDAEFTVVEADEFDRSFLQLSPFASIVTTTDADHMDIYQDNDAFMDGFKAYVDRIQKDGFLVRNAEVLLVHNHTISYSIAHEADYRAENLRYIDEVFRFDLITPDGTWEGVELGIPGIHNAENAVAVIAMCLNIGMSEEEIREGLKSFRGVKRRFEYLVQNEDTVYIDDYAHHPTEIRALLSSVRLLYPGRRIIGVFQPHLFSRTRDFFDGFVNELSRLDELILMPIYPAREEPIKGVSSEHLLEAVTCEQKSLMTAEEVVKKFEKGYEGVVLTIGAGDIDRIVSHLKRGLMKQ